VGTADGGCVCNEGMGVGAEATVGSGVGGLGTGVGFPGFEEGTGVGARKVGDAVGTVDGTGDGCCP